ncbi:prominin family protein [Paenibacillus hamazuiensis]|uniref:prominin family protein n=1 Tax=Paenibacillus hamazuiensis TaxID=2936508 RepID=UPI00200F1F5E|nr:prominin family protein [Paenibacillus hamazuiensis]
MSNQTKDPITIFVDEETERILGDLQNAVHSGIEEVLQQSRLAKQRQLEELEETVSSSIKAADLNGEKRSEKIQKLLKDFSDHLQTVVQQQSAEGTKASQELMERVESVRSAVERELAALLNKLEETEHKLAVMNDKVSELQTSYEKQLSRLNDRLEEQAKEWRSYREEQELLQSVPGFWMFFFGKQKALEKARKPQS